MSIEKYLKLSEEDKLWYRPVYKTYKVTKHREYETCDLGHEHFMGWQETRKGMGQPISYEKVGAFEHIGNVAQARQVEQINKSNIIMERVLSRPSPSVKDE